MTREMTNHDGTDRDRAAVATAVQIVFGRRTLRAAEADALDVGSVVPLDVGAEGPVGLYVDGRLAARGEPVVVEGRLAVRVSGAGESRE